MSKPTKYTDVELWDMIIEESEPTELGKKFLSKNIAPKQLEATICGKTLVLLIQKGHINPKETLFNWWWRVDRLYCIRNKSGQIITFVLNPAQRYFLQNKWFRNIILKSRQLGFSTMALIVNWDDAFWNKNRNNMLVAHKEDDAKKLFTRIKFAYKSMPDFLKDLVYVNSMSAAQIELGHDGLREANGDMKQMKDQPGKVVSRISVSLSGRSDAISKAHISELAYVDRYAPEKAIEILDGTIPALPHDGELTIESTSQGDMGTFASMYKSGSENPISHKDFKPFFFNWTWNKEDLAFISEEEIEFVTSWDYPDGDTFMEYQKKHKLSDRELACYYSFWKSLGCSWDRIRREYPTTAEEALQNMSDLVFSGEKLDNMKTTTYREDRNWEFYEEPIPGHRYVLGADVGAGQGGDPSTISILDLETNKEVACFEDKMTEPDVFAYQIAEKGRYYNTAYAAVELNNVGRGTNAKLKEIYPMQQIHKFIRKGRTHDRRTTQIGWETGNNKPTMVADLKTAIQQEEVFVLSEKTVKQLRGYSREEIVKNNKISIKFGDKIKGGAHFDRVDALMIAWQVRPDALLYAAHSKKSSKMAALIAKRKGNVV